ncbi:MAG: rhomboid family intramembrane serine protease [Lapillicoccus sp.]
MTPVLVQPDGWGHLVFNLLGLGVVGGALERYTSRPVWALTYLLGGVGGIAVMGARHPADLGGGSSDGLAALIGALTVLLAGEDRPDHHDRMGRRSWAGRPTQDYCVFFGAYLTGLDLGGSGGPSPPATPRSSPSSSPVVH